ncbi:MAG: hypothetical protein IH983_14220 [Planctomycetes bacterium]|nr:hypothetical protein [Planctomycetota bacterium]
MQNRFTVKDFFYVVIGLVICLLLFLNMVKTNREVEALDRVQRALKQQNTTLGKLQRAIAGVSAGARTDATTFQEGSPDGVDPREPPPARTPSGPDDEPFQENVAALPSYQPGVDIAFSSASPAVNRHGMAQQWQTGPDAELPQDFTPGDTLILVWNAQPQTLTPFVSRDAYAARLSHEIFEPLCWVNLERPFEYVPGLARSWEVSEDGLELIFHLFPNAVWSDGEPVTADDVIFTFDLVMNDEIDAPHLRSYLKENLQQWYALDPHTVRFHMKDTYFDAVGICGNLLWILPEHVYGDLDPQTYNTRVRELCVGSGPWVLDSWTKGNQLVLARNENYWGPKPALKKQIIRVIISELAELQEFKAGNVDLIGPTPQQWTLNVDSQWLAQRGRSVLYHSPLRGYAYIGYNLRLAKLADKRVRQAFAMLLDRREMIDTLREGLGRIITGPFYFDADQYDRTIEPWPYDPQRARRLLAEVGWVDRDGDGVLDADLNGDGIREQFEITFLMPSGSTYAQRLQRYVQEKFQQAGIKVNLDQLEWFVFEQRLRNRDFEMVSLAANGRPEADPYPNWHSSQADNRGSNDVGFIHPEADRLIEEARRTLDYEKRMKLWHRFHRILHEEQPFTFLFTQPSLAFVDGRFRNVHHRPLRLYTSEWYVPLEVQLR